MIENEDELYQDELYQLEKKQAKGAKLLANIRWQLEGEKCLKTFFKVVDRQELQNQKIFELYTDDNKTKYFSNHKEILKSAKTIYGTLHTNETTFKAATTEFFLAKFLIKAKDLINNLTFVRRKYI